MLNENSQPDQVFTGGGMYAAGGVWAGNLAGRDQHILNLFLNSENDLPKLHETLALFRQTNIPNRLDPLPRMDDLFEIIEDSEKVAPAIFRQGRRKNSIAPYDVSYNQSRHGTNNFLKELAGLLVDAGGMLIVKGRSGIGKTREISELALDLCSRGWIICVSKPEGDKSLNRLEYFPQELNGKRLLLIIDDIHRRAMTFKASQFTYPERLEAFLNYLEEQTSPGSIHVIATARSEPRLWKMINFNPNQTPWNRFGLFELPEFTQEDLGKILFELAKDVQVFVNPSETSSMILNSDRTLRSIVLNVEEAYKRQDQLSLTNWLPSMNETWYNRLRVVAAKTHDSMSGVFQALYLIREVGLPTNIAYINRLGNILTNTAVQETIELLLEMGLLNANEDILDAFSDEQLSESFKALGIQFGDPDQYWDSIAQAIMYVTPQPANWFNDLITLSQRIVSEQKSFNQHEPNPEIVKKFHLAISILDIATDQVPTSIPPYLMRGAVKFLVGDYSGAENDWSCAIDHGYINFHPFFKSMLGQARLFQGKFQAAEGIYTEVIKYGETDGKVYALRGATRFFQGNYAGAESDFCKAIETIKGENELFYTLGYFLGVAQLEQGKFSSAESELTKSIELGMNTAKIYYQRGRSRHGQGKYAEGESDFIAAIERDPSEVNARLMRISSHLMQGKLEGSIKDDLNFLIDRGENHAIGDGGYAHFYNLRSALQSDFTAIESDLTLAIKRGMNDDKKVYINRGKARLFQNDYVGAEADFTTGINLDSSDAELYFFRGMTRNILENPEAEEDFNLAIAHGQKGADVYYSRGLSRLNQEKYTDAVADFNSAIEQGQKDHDIFSSLGLALRCMKRPQDAREVYQKAIEQDDSHAADWLGLASCARATGDEATWKDALARARSLIGDEDLCNRACLASIAGETDQAFDLLKAALLENPENAAWAQQDPDFEWIRSDPRFEQLLKDIAAK